MLGRRSALVGQRIAVRIGVVGQRIEGDRLVLGRGDRVIDRNRRVVDVVHRDRDGRRVGPAIAVGDRVGERIRPHEARRRGVDDLARHDLRGPVGRSPDRLDRQRVAVHIRVVAEHVDRHRSALVGARGIVHRIRRVVHRRDVDRDGARVGQTARVLHDIGDGVRPVVVRIRRVGDGPVRVHRDRAMLGRRSALVGQRIAVRVGVVGQRVEGDRLVLGRGDRVIDRHRRVVDAADVDGDRGHIRAAVAVAHRVGEAVGAVEVGIRRVDDLARDDLDRAVGRRGQARDGERIAVHVGVIGQHVDGDGGVLRGGDRVVTGHRGIVHRGHVDGDRRRVGGTGRIGHRVGDRVRAIEVRRRGIVDRAVRVHRHGAAVGRNRGPDDRQGVAVRVGVVGQRVQRDRRVLGRGRRVVHGDRRVIDAANRHGDGCGVGPALPVRDRVGDRVRAVEVRVRRIDDLAAHDGRGAVGRGGDVGDGQRIAVHIRVVAQDVDRDGGVLGGRGRVVCSHRGVVHRGHGDGHGGGIGVPVTVADRVGDRVGAVVVGIRRVDDLPAHDGRSSVRRVGHVDDGERIALRIRVVGQHVDGDRIVLGRGGRVVDRIGFLVDLGIRQDRLDLGEGQRLAVREDHGALVGARIRAVGRLVDRHLARAAQVQRVVVGVLVRTVAADDDIARAFGRARDLEDVVALTAGHGVLAGATDDGVVAAFAEEGVIPRSAEDRVVARNSVAAAVPAAGRIEVDVRDVDFGGVVAVLLVLDLEPRDRAGNVHQDRVIGAGVRRRVVAGVADGFLAADAVLVGQGQVRPVFGFHVDGDEIAVQVIGLDCDLGVRVDVVDPEGHVRHGRGEGPLVGRALVVRVQARRHGGILVRFRPVRGDRMHLLLVGLELGFRALVRRLDREGHVDRTGVLREAAGQRIVVVDRAGAVRIGRLVPFEAFAGTGCRRGGAAAVRAVIAVDDVLAGAAFDRVVAAATVDGVVARPAEDRVVAIGTRGTASRTAVRGDVAVGQAGILDVRIVGDLLDHRVLLADRDRLVRHEADGLVTVQFDRVDLDDVVRIGGPDRTDGIGIFGGEARPGTGGNAVDRHALGENLVQVAILEPGVRVVHADRNRLRARLDGERSACDLAVAQPARRVREDVAICTGHGEAVQRPGGQRVLRAGHVEIDLARVRPAAAAVAEDQVGTLAALDPVVAGVAVELVVAFLALDRVVARVAVDGVVAETAFEKVVIRFAAVDPVEPALGVVDGFQRAAIVGPQFDLHRGVDVQRQGGGHVALEQDLAVDVENLGIAALRRPVEVQLAQQAALVERQLEVVVPAVEPGQLLADEIAPVEPLVAVRGIVPEALAVVGIGDGAGRATGRISINDVITGTAEDRVLAAAAVDFVVALAGIDLVVALARDDDIVIAGFPGENGVVAVDLVAVGIRVAGADHVVAGGAFDIAVAMIRAGGPTAVVMIVLQPIPEEKSSHVLTL